MLWNILYIYVCVYIYKKIYAQKVELVFTFSLEKYPEVELLGHMVVLLLIF